MQMQGGYQKGFTLIELISVVVLLSILGVAAFSRLGNMKGFESAGFYYDTITALRYAQKLAISTGCNVQATLTANSYALQQRQIDCNTGAYTLPVPNPANRAQNYTANVPAGSGITINPAAVFQFTPQSTITGLAADTVFTIDGRQFTVFQLSGLIDAQ
jgi:MSHA pilin protein MshC